MKVMKLKYQLAVLVVGGLATLGVAHAQFGGLMKKPGGDSGQTSSAMSIADWIKIANDAKVLLDKSSSSLLEAVASKDELDKINALKKAASEAKDDKAKKELQLKIETETNAVLKAANYDQLAANLAKENNAKKTAGIGNAAFNFVLGVLKDKELLDTANAVMDGAKSNPMALKDIGKVKDVVSSISGQMAAMTAITTNLPKLAKVAKVEMPKSSTESPKESSI
jgi:hypothetical protein